MKHKRLILAGGIAGLLVGSAVALSWDARPYTSTAVLRLNPSMLPDRLVPAQTQIGIETRLPGIVQTVNSRGNLSTVVSLHNLFPGERLRMPLEDVIDMMRAAIRITPARESSFEVSFSYPDRMVAQKVAADLVSRIITEFSRERQQITVLNLQFLRDTAAKAGTAWEESVAKVRSAQSAGKPLDRLTLDADIARQRYQNLSERVAEAEMLGELEKRQQGQALELLDPPSLPSDSRPPVVLTIVLAGLVGALLGWLGSLALAARSRQAVPQAA